MSTSAPRPKAAKVAESPEELEARVAEFNRRTSAYELRDVQRSKINPAPYNPRTMPDSNRKRLRGSLDKTGFVAPPFVWNDRTGILVSGHQRLAWLDRQAKAAKLPDDYIVKNVSVVNVDDATERALNYALNNPQSQGLFDLEKLSPMLGFEGFDLTTAGLEANDIPRLVGGMESAAELMPQEMLDVLDQLSDESERYDKIVETTTSYPDGYIAFVFRGSTEATAALEAAGLDTTKWLHSGDLFDEMTKRLATYRAKYGDIDDA